MAVLDYGLDDTEPQFESKSAEAMFVLTKPTLGSSKARATAGAAGGRVSRSPAERPKDEKPIKEPSKRVDYDGVVTAYHEICKSYPKVKSVSDARKKAIAARLKEYSLDDLRECFRLAEESDFLKGKNSKNWSADFDWLLKSSNLPKVLEGKYDNKGGTGQNTAGFSCASADDALRSRKQAAALLEELR